LCGFLTSDVPRMLGGGQANLCWRKTLEPQYGCWESNVGTAIVKRYQPPLPRQAVFFFLFICLFHNRKNIQVTDEKRAWC
jgi:hypothetical protein